MKPDVADGLFPIVETEGRIARLPPDPLAETTGAGVLAAKLAWFCEGALANDHIVCIG